MVMSGLELAFDLSRNDFNMNVNSSRNLLNNKRSVTPQSTQRSNYDAGLQYIPGEFGGYQAVLKKERSQYLPVAMLALNTSEPEKRSTSRSSDSSGVSSMASGSFVDQSLMKLRYQNVAANPVMHQARNVLNLSANIDDGSNFFYNAPRENPNILKAISPPETSVESFEGANDIFKCPKCGFEMPREFLPNDGEGYSCIL